MISIKEQINNFADGLVENIINTPDAEILQEVKEEYGSEDFLANKCRKIFEKAASSNGLIL